jgi:hypothetical protein
VSRSRMIFLEKMSGAKKGEIILVRIPELKKVEIHHATLSFANTKT